MTMRDPWETFKLEPPFLFTVSVANCVLYPIEIIPCTKLAAGRRATENNILLRNLTPLGPYHIIIWIVHPLWRTIQAFRKGMRGIHVILSHSYRTFIPHATRALKLLDERVVIQATKVQYILSIFLNMQRPAGEIMCLPFRPACDSGFFGGFTTHGLSL